MTEGNSLKINIKIITDKHYLTIFSFLLSILFLFQWLNTSKQTAQLTQVIVRDRFVKKYTSQQKIITPNEHYLQVTDFYSEIISVYLHLISFKCFSAFFHSCFVFIYFPFSFVDYK